MLSTFRRKLAMLLAIFAVNLSVMAADIPSATDLDDDNDGIVNTLEGGGTDPYGDADLDGTLNYLDTTPGGAVPAFIDTNFDGVNDAYDKDRDGIVNSFDLDSDNDGIPDIIEAGGVDLNNDGKVDGTADINGNGLIDTYDPLAGGIALTNRDFDGDGIPNYLDLDSDGDGIPDVEEAAIVHVSISATASGTIGATGWSITVDALLSLTLPNNDLDIHPNYLDIDSDNDGITDNVEGQYTNQYVLPSGADNDKDGIDNSYDVDFSGSFYISQGIIPVNFQGAVDVLPDYIDPDADDDGIFDIIEGHDADKNGIPDYLLTGLDTDGDGLDNGFDMDNTGPNVKNQGMNGIVPPFGFDNPPADPPAPGARGPLQKIITTNQDRAWRTINIGAILPLTLLKFTAEKLSGDYVLLNWESSNETGFKEYVLERSTDGMNYTVATIVPGKGGLTAKYAYTDNAGSQAGTKLYYRLRQVDVNGRVTYSRILSVSLEPANGITLLITPNPSTGNVALKVSSNKKHTAAINIMDAQGRIVFSKRTNITNGDNIIMLMEAGSLGSGMYTVQLNTEEERLSVRLIIQK